MNEEKKKDVANVGDANHDNIWKWWILEARCNKWFRYSSMWTVAACLCNAHEKTSHIYDVEQIHSTFHRKQQQQQKIDKNKHTQIKTNLIIRFWCLHFT